MKKTYVLTATSLLFHTQLAVAQVVSKSFDIEIARTLRERLEREEEKEEEIKRAALISTVVLANRAATTTQPRQNNSSVPNRCPMVVDKVSGSLTIICGDNTGHVTTFQRIQKNSNNKFVR